MNQHSHSRRTRRLQPFVLLPAFAAASAIAQTSPTTEPTAPPAELPAVEVVGRTESGTYHSSDASGTRTELPLRELPQSVRMITRQAMDDLGATRVDDVLDYVGGVSRQNNFGGLWDNIAIRGLPGNENTGMGMLLNGFASNRGFNAPRDLAGVERIEFLKGPAAALYGASEPGGTLNVVSKRPLWKPAHAIEAYGGNYGLWRGALDSTGPIGGSFAYRLNLAAEQRDSFRDHIHTRREVAAPAFTWRVGPDTFLEYVGEYLRHRAPLDRGVVAIDNRLGAIPRNRFLGEPTDGDVTVTNLTHQLVLSHEWNADWRSRFGLAYKETSLLGFSTEATALRADGTLTRQRRHRDYDSDDFAVQAEMQGRLRVAGMEHEVLVGLDASRFSFDQRMLRVNPTATVPYAINVFDPVYGQAQPSPLPNTDTLEESRTTALYLQDAIKVSPQWRVVAGLRVDRTQQRLLNRRNNVTTTQDPTETSPRLGVAWLPDARWTVYANAGQSFRPNAGADAFSTAFAPERGRSLEAGVKWEGVDRRLGATLAVFDIRKRNVLTADPVNTGFQMTAGEIRSRGAEFDLAGQVSRHWRINASLVVNDVEITRDNTLEVGGRLLNVPRVNGSLLAVYEDAFASGQRFGIGGGVTHVGKRLGQAFTQVEADAGAAVFDLPAYTTTKLVAYWRVHPRLRLTLDVDNLFDETYYTSSFSRVWVTPGWARTVMVGLQAKF